MGEALNEAWSVSLESVCCSFALRLKKEPVVKTALKLAGVFWTGS